MVVAAPDTGGGGGLLTRHVRGIETCNTYRAKAEIKASNSYQTSGQLKKGRYI
jgi:hypothetical protein